MTIFRYLFGYCNVQQSNMPGDVVCSEGWLVSTDISQYTLSFVALLQSGQ